MFSSKHEAAAVAGFLRERFAEVEDVEPFGKGEWSQAFSFHSGERALVARFGQFAGDYEKDRAAMRFAAPGLPVPEIVDIGEAFGGAYAISMRAFGRGFDELDETGYRRALPAAFLALDTLRCADTSASTGYGIWEPDGNAPYGSWREMLLDVDNDQALERVRGWRTQLARDPAAVERFGEGYRLLQVMVEVCPEDRHVIHADLMGDNLIVDGDRIAAVVDWGNSMYGDFLYDLARLIFWIPWFPELRDVDIAGLAREHYAAIGFEVPDFDERLRCCQVHLGLEAQAYNAFTKRWEELERSGLRTLELGRT